MSFDGPCEKRELTHTLAVRQTPAYMFKTASHHR
jgi:hypothetical protein